MVVVGVVLAVALVMMLVEANAPGRNWPRVSGFWTRALALNAGQVAVSLAAGTAWNGWMATRRPWSADALGSVAGAVVGYVAITFVYYWWHRWRHESPFLWRVFHQVHHSPQRIEIITSFYKHPIEVLATVSSRARSSTSELASGRRPRQEQWPSADWLSSSTTGMCGLRIGSVTSSNAPKATACTTRRVCTPSTTLIFPSGTCSLAHFATHATSTRDVASAAMSTAWAPCWRGST
jgi:Fatty acid hydroxylase superfamily